MLKALLTCLLCGLLNSIYDPAWSASLTGQVFRVHSGDQIVLSSSSGQFHEIELLGIRSPPLNTYQGRLSRKYLHMLLAGKFVTIVYHRLTPQGVVLGQVLHGGVDINQRMIETGWATATPEQGMDQQLLDRYVASQEAAAQQGLGMWKKNH